MRDRLAAIRWVCCSYCLILIATAILDNNYSDGRLRSLPIAFVIFGLTYLKEKNGEEDKG